ncbi:MAG: AAA family ATPase, partial [Proteobacteria bacterium]|nr:AAA family ATPase [Pseudomonadota bacterium]
FAAEQDQPADLTKLSQSGYLIRSNSSAYPVHASWAQMTKLMQESKVFDRVASQIQAVVCSNGTNRSVLLVGEPSDTWRYVFARLAMMQAIGSCDQTVHTEVDISKIEAGHMYVGQVDQYWNEEILQPVDRRNAILYFSSLNQLIGLGSHSHDDTGIEAEYANNISAGRMRSVAFMNKYEYEYYSRSPHAYVLNSFAVTVKLDEMLAPEINELQQDFLRVLAPKFVLVPKEQDFLNRTATFYLPNVLEPQRSINVIKKLIQKHGGADPQQLIRVDQPLTDFETLHPYTNDVTWERIISYPDAVKLKLHFSSFKTESNYDKLVIVDVATGATLATYSGNKGPFETEFFGANKIKLLFRSDKDHDEEGFAIDRVSVFSADGSGGVTFEREDIRRTIMEIAQVPTWLIDRQFEPVKNLRAKLDGDVVGCQQAKSDAVRLAKVGYVGGRTDDKPIAAHMFVGPTGTGKSYIARRLAEYLGIKLITFDMTAYRTPESFDRFLDTLAENLILYPFAIYLFEEVDKADSKILDRLYFMTDEGILYDKYQRPLFARGAYIIITTNAAEDAIISNPNAPNLPDLVDVELRKLFRPSFLNRLDAVSIFKPFTQDEYQQLATIMVKKKVSAVQKIFDWTMAVDQPSVRYIGKYGQSARYGARPMERLLDSVITAGVAEYQLEYGPLFAGRSVSIEKSVPIHEFTVGSDGKKINYTVDPRSNGGGSFKNGLFSDEDNGSSGDRRRSYEKLEGLLRSEPIWSDRD